MSHLLLLQGSSTLQPSFGGAAASCQSEESYRLLFKNAHHCALAWEDLCVPFVPTRRSHGSSEGLG